MAAVFVASRSNYIVEGGESEARIAAVIAQAKKAGPSNMPLIG
jgi:hypothetical protein